MAERLRVLLRRNARTSIAVGIVVGLGAGLVLALAAGAHRTATAPKRFTDAFGGRFDVGAVQPYGPSMADQVAKLPGVEGVGSLTFAAAAPAGGGAESDTFAGTGTFPGDRILEGRLPDPSDPHEFVANAPYVDLFDLRVGDRLHFEALDQDQTDRSAYTEEPAGVGFEGTLVGITGGLSMLDDPVPTALFSSALLQEDVGQVSSLLFVDLAAGVTADQLLTAAQALPGGQELSLQYDRMVSDSLRDSVRAASTGLWLVAAVSAIVVIAAVGQLLVRHVRSETVDRLPLQALGYTSRQLVGESVARAGVVVVVGAALGTLVAAAFSGTFPVGFARGLEPSPGLRIDAPILLFGALALTLALMAWVAAGVAHQPVRTRRPSSTAEALARTGITPSAATGVRFALARGHDGTSSSVTIAALGLAVAGVLAAVVFGVSMNRLVVDGFRHGKNFDMVIGSSFQPSPVDLGAALQNDAAVEGLMVLSGTAAQARGEVVNLVGVEAVRGGLVPRVVAGRFPASSDEVALGRVTARELGAKLGDDVTLEAARGQATYRVVGYVVMPAFYFGEGVGRGGATLPEGLRRLDPDAADSVAAVRLAPGATPDDIGRVAALSSVPADQLELPPDVTNIDRIRSVPALLAAVLAIFATLTLVHSLVSSVRSRRHDVAVLRSLGADRRWLGHTVHWQAITLAAVALAVGIPAGMVTGRIVFRAFAERIGAVSDPATPTLLLVTIALATIVVANVAAVIPARRARRLPAALLLRSE